MSWFAKNFRKREKFLYIERDTGVKESKLVGEMKRMVAGMKKRYKIILILYEIYLFRRFLLLAKNTPRIWALLNGEIFFRAFLLRDILKINSPLKMHESFILGRRRSRFL